MITEFTFWRHTSNRKMECVTIGKSKCIRIIQSVQECRFIFYINIRNGIIFFYLLLNFMSDFGILSFVLTDFDNIFETSNKVCEYVLKT